MVEVKPNGDWCITFPVKAPDNAVVLADKSAIEFLNDILLVKRFWVDTGRVREDLSHNVSATIVVKDDEWDSILERVWQERDNISGLTFLPAMSDKNIPYVPREEVCSPQDEAKWQYLVENYKPVDYNKMKEESDGTKHIQDPACSGGKCDL